MKPDLLPIYIGHKKRTINSFKKKAVDNVIPYHGTLFNK